MKKADNVIFYHEDFYRQIELVPESNFFSIDRNLMNHKYAVPNEFGIKDCTVRSEHHGKFIDKKIPLSDVDLILSKFAYNKFTNITSGYGDTTYKVKNSIAWGYEYYGVFVEHVNNEVRNIWMGDSDLFIKDNSGKMLLKAIFTIGAKYGLILIDWNKEMVVRVSNINLLKQYLIDVHLFDISM